jgi:hypothetical protein
MPRVGQGTKQRHRCPQCGVSKRQPSSVDDRLSDNAFCMAFRAIMAHLNHDTTSGSFVTELRSFVTVHEHTVL